MAECPNPKRCLFFQTLALQATGEALKKYCYGTYRRCARFRLKELGRPVPPDMSPGYHLPEDLSRRT